ncbi:MAG: hypothetical protein L6R37_004029 [Teloschistes peruensis]|nr:MAG: hypothetical protein L6R37_004029 [Teloschistes peruensis]
MASKKFKPSTKSTLPFKTGNKEKRQKLHITRKKALDNTRRDERFRRRREEDKDPSLREERLRKNIPLTLERKRVWDDVDGDIGDGLGVSVDVERLKRQKLAEEVEANDDHDQVRDQEQPDSEDDRDSMIDSPSDSDSNSSTSPPLHLSPKTITARASSPSPSITTTTNSTTLNPTLAPSPLASRFPTLFPTSPPPVPKTLITTSLHSTLHHPAHLLTTLFPNSVYIPRSAPQNRHNNSHNYSIREIATFAHNRHYTALIVLKEDQKHPTGLTIVHLPSGPTFTFSISNWVEGKKIPGHGRPTDHTPELILNNFRTPLGLLTAHLFRSLFPSQPEFAGRQVVTLHNQRDYIFLRRHRYVFREKKGRERNVVGVDGKDVGGGVEGIRAGLQELGPRFTMKLRRVDKGVQAGRGEEWEWKGKMDKSRNKFQL